MRRQVLFKGRYKTRKFYQLFTTAEIQYHCNCWTEVFIVFLLLLREGRSTVNRQLVHSKKITAKGQKIRVSEFMNCFNTVFCTILYRPKNDNSKTNTSFVTSHCLVTTPFQVTFKMAGEFAEYIQKEAIWFVSQRNHPSK